MGNEWTTIRIKRARKDAVAVRAEADGLSAAEWADRALAAALSGADQEPSGSGAAPARVAAAPRRASDHPTSAQAKAGVKPIPRSTERKGK